MTQKTRKKPKKQSSQISKKRLAYIFLLIFLFAFLTATLSYFIMKNESTNKVIKTKEEPIKQIKKKKPEELKEFDVKEFEKVEKKEITKNDKYEEITQEFHKDIIEDKEEDKKIEIKKEIPTVQKPEEEKKQTDIKTQKPKYDEKDYIAPKDSYKFDGKSKPKLAILIDDVSTTAQKNKILNIGYKINMAFLPPTKKHPNSAKIAKDLPFHMIHFPLQASSSFKGAEDFTLNINDSYEKIEKRVAQLRAWYPDVIYTNNHTGSIFTENEESIDKLFKALKKHNFIFVDSRTTSKSVVKKYALKYDMPYIVRNTFIDNERDYVYIQNQLKKAIAIAMKKGYAIAIGHPHNITLQVLKESKELLKNVEPIYINELPYLK